MGKVHTVSRQRVIEAMRATDVETGHVAQVEATDISGVPRKDAVLEDAVKPHISPVGGGKRSCLYTPADLTIRVYHSGKERKIVDKI